MAIRQYQQWPEGNTEVQYLAMKQVLDRAPAFVCMDIATDKRKMNRKSGAAVALRRWANPAIDTTANNTGISKTPRALAAVDFTGTMNRYTEAFQASRYEYDLHPWDSVKGATDVLSDFLIPETMETIRYNAAKAITTILYNSAAITSRAAVNGTISLGRIQTAVRGIRNYRGEPFRAAEVGQARDGTSPVEAAYYGFVHSDAEPDLRVVPGFKTVAEYPGGKGLAHEFGCTQNVRWFTSPTFAPYANAGAASTTLKATGVTGTSSGSADVYPFIIVAKHALTSIDLSGTGKAGFGNAMVNVLDKADKSDYNNDRIIVASDWYDLCIVTSNEWGCVIECGVTRNPT
jgi:N4-gp56 family major capsid protein